MLAPGAVRSEQQALVNEAAGGEQQAGQEQSERRWSGQYTQDQCSRMSTS